MRWFSRWVSTILTVLTAASVTPAHAQRLASVPLGSQVRLVTCAGASITGKFGGIRSDSVDLAVDSVVTSTVTFPPDRVTVARAVAVDCVRTYSVFERYGSSAGRGALVGGGVGLALIGVAWAGDRAYERKGGAATLPAIAVAVPIALVLTGVGAWIGSASGPEQWSVPQGIAAQIRMLPRGGVAALSLRFPRSVSEPKHHAGGGGFDAP
jgi:hypothetical protein